MLILQEKVYSHLIETLDKAISIITPLVETKSGIGLKADADKVYGGKMNQWCKFANSLKLRMAIRMRFVNQDEAQRIAVEAYKAELLNRTRTIAL